MSGQLIGHRYRVLRKIGEGGMAVVHIAVDEKLGRDVAIKILRERYENHDEIRTRFQHEARAISAFDHPNILKVYDFSGEDSRQLWIVTELIHGRNLAQILETTPSGWLHPVIAASIVREICRALASAHEHGVVHRDVKPENVMITHHGIVKLMDFGIAKIQRITSMTQTGMFMGSPSYMSPEQVRGRDVDNRSDIYSLGVLFYELITGKLPFTGSSTADIAMRILNGDFAHPRFIMAGIPDAIDQCIVQCMSIQPEQRPQSIEIVGDMIDNMLQSLKLESSRQELERCFKDPKAYGDRLSKILKVSEPKQEPTVIVPSNQISPVAKWNNEAIKSPIPRPDITGEHLPSGSQRRDHLLPPRSVPHFTRKQMSAELISAHLPERRHQQRATEFTHLGPATSPHGLNSKPHVPAKMQKGTNRPNTPPTPPRQVAGHFVAPPPKNPNRTMRPISRIVPPAPKRPQRQIRYAPQEPHYYRESSGTFSKFVVAMLLFASAAIIWLGNNRATGHRPKQTVTTANRGKKNPVRNTPLEIAKSQSPIEMQSKNETTSDASTVKSIAAEKSPEKPIEKATEPLPKFAQKNQETQKKINLQNRENENKNPRPMQVSNYKPEASPPDTNTKDDIKRKTKTESKRSTEDQSGNALLGKTKVEPQKAKTIEADKPTSTTVINDASQNQKQHEEIEAPTTIPQRKQIKTSPKTSDQEKPIVKVQLSVASSPAAELYLDGRRQGTTNDNGASSDWIETTSGQHRIELRRSGFVTRKEAINVSGEPKQRFGPYSLQRGESGPSPSTIYKLTLTTNLPPVEVTIINIDSNATQTITLNSNTKTMTLDKGVYEVTMNRKGELRKRRLDFTGATQQLTFSVDFKDQGN